MAANQQAYEVAVKDVFNGLDKLEKLLEGKEYIVGNQLTEVDIRTWVTAVRLFCSRTVFFYLPELSS